MKTVYCLFKWKQDRGHSRSAYLAHWKQQPLFAFSFGVDNRTFLNLKLRKMILNQQEREDRNPTEAEFQLNLWRSTNFLPKNNRDYLFEDYTSNPKWQ